MSIETTNVSKNVEGKVNHGGLCTKNQIEVDIQITCLKMLHAQGILTDSIYSTALSKIMKGVIQ